MSTEDYNRINEVVYNGNRTYIENGEVKTILSKDIQNNNGDMTVEQLREIVLNEVTMIYDKFDKRK